MLALRSIETKSPFSTVRSTPLRVPNRSCSAMSRASTSSGEAFASSTSTVIPLKSSGRST
jgi:hypothetical protein